MTFFDAYYAHVRSKHAWAANYEAPHVKRFWAVVRETLETDQVTWLWDTPEVRRLYRETGGKGRMTLTKLRALHTAQRLTHE